MTSTRIRRALAALVLVVVGAAAGMPAAPTAAGPVAVPAPVGWRQVSGGSNHSCGITATGAAYCWGSDGNQQLGNGTVQTNQIAPSPVTTPAGVTWAAIDAGSTSTCAVTTAGAVYCWGYVNGGLVAAPSVVTASGGTVWRSVSIGSNHTCALSAAGAISCWGSDISGALGNGALSGTRTSPTPVAAPAGVTWVSVSSGGNFSCAVSTTGVGYCWGADSLGQLGNGATVVADQQAPVPVETPAGTAWRSINVGSTSACGVTTADAALCWGSDDQGKLGNGAAVTADQHAPGAVVTAAGVAWATIDTGDRVTCGVTTAGAGLCWGYDGAGNLGNGPITGTQHAPSAVVTAAGVTWASISVRGDAPCATSAASTGFCWGWAIYGQVGDGSAATTNRTAPSALARLAQTLTFPAPAEGRAGDQRDLAGTATSGLPVAFTASGSCTVVGTTLTLGPAGTCTVTASQPGDATWAAATSVVQTLAVAANPVPTVVAGDDLAVHVGHLATLGATATDPDGEPLTLAWTQTAGPSVALSDPASPAPTFTAPAEPTTLTFTVTATDPAAGTATDEVTVAVVRRRIAGTVTADPGGAPIAGARVRLYRDGVGYLEHFADTGADGTWSIQGMPAGSYRISISDPTLAHVAEWWGDTPVRSASTAVTVPTSLDQAGMDVVLARGATVAGTITAPGSFDVYLYAGDPATTSASKVLKGQVGSFSFTGLAAGTYHVLVKDPTGAVKDLWGPGRTTRAEATPIPLVAGQTATATYAHPPQSSIGGLVTDHAGPVAGVTVQLYDAATGAFVRSTKTDATGAYRLTPVVAGTYKVVFRDATGAHVVTWHGGADSLASAGTLTMATGGVLTVDQELVATATLRGTITAAGQPAAGIRVIVHQGGRGVRSALTGPDGAWAIAGLAAGTYQVGYSDPAAVLAPEYHQDAAKLAGSTPIALGPGDAVDLAATLARR